MSRTEVRGAAPPRGNARPAHGCAPRSAGRRGLVPPHHLAGGPGATPDGAHAQRGVAKMLSATTDQPP
jgi:hypothetical protein